MPLAVADIVELIDLERETYLGISDPIGRTRAHQLDNIRDYLNERGYPTDSDERCKLSLLPFVFQEAIYDSIDWYEREADLSHLANILSIDFLVYSGGRSRVEASDGEFKEYHDAFDACLKRWQRGM